MEIWNKHKKIENWIYSRNLDLAAIGGSFFWVGWANCMGGACWLAAAKSAALYPRVISCQ
jgi:hypothetical protein